MNKKLSISQYLQSRQDDTPTKQDIIRKFYYEGADKIFWELQKAGYHTNMTSLNHSMCNFVTYNPEFKNYVSWRNSTLTIRETDITEKEYISGLRKIIGRASSKYEKIRYITQYHNACTVLDKQRAYLKIDKILKASTDTLLTDRLITEELALMD